MKPFKYYEADGSLNLSREKAELLLILFPPVKGMMPPFHTDKDLWSKAVEEKFNDVFRLVEAIQEELA